MRYPIFNFDAIDAAGVTPESVGKSLGMKQCCCQRESLNAFVGDGVGLN